MGAVAAVAVTFVGGSRHPRVHCKLCTLKDGGSWRTATAIAGLNGVLLMLGQMVAGGRVNRYPGQLAPKMEEGRIEAEWQVVSMARRNANGEDDDHVLEFEEVEVAVP